MQSQRPLPPIWVLNLRRSAKRRAYIADHLGALGLPYQLIEAVDGRELSTSDLAAAYSGPLSVRHIGRAMTPGEIGCSLSHRALYQKLIDEGLDEVVILEDDALVDHTFMEILDQRDALPADWELVLLFRGESRISYWGRRKLGRFRCVKFASVSWGTVGYLLRRSGAQKLLTHGTPVCVPADYLTGGGIRTGVHLYGIDPPCVRELPSAATASTMPEVAAVRAKWPTRDEFGRIPWFLHRWKWRFIHFYQRANPFSIL